MWPFGGRLFPGTNLQDLNLDWIIQRVKALSTGIIAPYINPANFHWMVYDTEAENFVDSGVSAAGEGTGPQGEPGKSPVIGSNGHWYVWDVDTEAYVDSGIDATGPVGPQGRIGPQGPQGSPGVNPNVLINPYFAGGGSQSGDGVFPINQREQTVYSSAGYTIDHWTSVEGITVTLEADGISLVNAANDRKAFSQRLPQDIRGKRISGSILMSDGSFYTGSALIPAEIPASAQYTTLIDFSGNTLRIAASPAGALYFQLMIAANAELKIIAFKLELGDAQSLARQQGNTWELIDLPEFSTELAKCQRFFLRIKNTAASIPVATGYMAVADGTTPTFYIPTPVKMAKAPAVSFSGSLAVYPPNSPGIAVTTLTRAFITSTGIAISSEIASGGPQGGGYVLRSSLTSVIDFDAE